MFVCLCFCIPDDTQGMVLEKNRGSLVVAHTCTDRHTVARTVVHRHNMDKHGKRRRGRIAPVGARCINSDMHTHKCASQSYTTRLMVIFLFLHTLSCTHTHTHHFCSCSAVLMVLGFNALLSVGGEFSRRHTKMSPPPPLTLSPLSSTVVIEDENGDDEALKNGTEKTPAEA